MYIVFFITSSLEWVLALSSQAETDKIFAVCQNFADLRLKIYPFFLVSRFCTSKWKNIGSFAKIVTSMDVRFGREWVVGWLGVGVEWGGGEGIFLLSEMCRQITVLKWLPLIHIQTLWKRTVIQSRPMPLCGEKATSKELHKTIPILWNWIHINTYDLNGDSLQWTHCFVQMSNQLFPQLHSLGSPLLSLVVIGMFKIPRNIKIFPWNICIQFIKQFMIDVENSETSQNIFLFSVECLAITVFLSNHI